MENKLTVRLIKNGEIVEFNNDLKHITDKNIENRFNVKIKKRNSKEVYDEKKEVVQEQFYTENKKISLQQIYEFIITQNKIRIINGSIYIYNSKFGYFEHIEMNNEGREINKFIHDSIRSKIRPNIITDIIKKLKDEPNIQVENDEVNSDKKLINCQNGVIDLESGELLNHKKEYLFTYCIRANFILDKNKIDTYNFEKFVETSLENNKRKRKLLLEIIGYLISNYNEAKKAFIFLGKPHSGKSLLSKLIAKLIGEKEVSNISLHKLGDRFSIAEFSNHKININAEINASKLNNLDVFKSIVGGDYITGEYKGQSPFSFKCRIKLLFCGNYMPELRDMEVGDAFVDRLTILLFNTTTPEEKRNYNLEELLISEIDSIFTLAIYELKKLVKRNFEFQKVDDSQAFIKLYRNEQNHINEFINERCILGEEYKIYSKDIYTEYINFCDDNCIETYSSKKFLSFLSNVPYIENTRFRMNGKNNRGYKGITIKK